MNRLLHMFVLASLAAAPLAAQQSAKLATPPATPAPSLYNGTDEYSLKISVTHYNREAGHWDEPKDRPTRVVEQLKGFTPRITPTDQYGGRLDRSAHATGFYYTKKIDNRWWVVDPAGHLMLHIGVATVRPLESPNADRALHATFGNKANWMAQTHTLLLKNAFNGTGGWSDVDAIRSSPLQSTRPLAYTIILDVMSSYGHVRSRGERSHQGTGHSAYPADTIFVFDPEFPAYATEHLKKFAQYADDPNLFGYFSDNEMPLYRNNLDGYLSLPASDPGHQAAQKFLDDHHAKEPTDDLRTEFLAFEVDRYFSIVNDAIRSVDKNHMLIGARFNKQNHLPEVFTAAGRYCGVISVNYYEAWQPDPTLLDQWEQASGRPILVSEFYAKGKDSGMPNHTGAGWLVDTQYQRGLFYQNFTLGLLESGNSIGWNWFRYQDNDPTDPHADPSNADSNKGIVSATYAPWQPLLDRMHQLNQLAYALTDYFDARKKSGAAPVSNQAAPSRTGNSK
jgi:hypothetical protein